VNFTAPTQNGSLEVFSYHHVFQMNGQTYTLTGATSPAAVPGALQLGLELRPGGMGNARLDILNGTLITQERVFVGNLPGSTGTLYLSNATWNNAPTLTSVGYRGNGSLVVDNSQVSVTAVANGSQAGSTGSVMVNGSGSNFSSTFLRLGDQGGSGALNVTGGGHVLNQVNTLIGNNVAGQGSVTVSGAGSTLENVGDIAVGYFGRGSLYSRAELKGHGGQQKGSRYGRIRLGHSCISAKTRERVPSRSVVLEK
jgi:T5SS/PEP-CTERM-associated repeat protein